MTRERGHRTVRARHPLPACDRVPFARDSETPMVSSRALFGSAQELLIEHAGAIYRLRRTAQGKLILTK